MAVARARNNACFFLQIELCQPVAIELKNTTLQRAQADPIGAVKFNKRGAYLALIPNRPANANMRHYLLCA
jgi:hypothetical protein